jgi:hypothetical protein
MCHVTTPNQMQQLSLTLLNAQYKKNNMPYDTKKERHTFLVVLPSWLH